MDERKTCLWCRWWFCRVDDVYSKLAYGECRRYPPTRSVSDKEPKVMSFIDSEKTYRILECSGWSIQTNDEDWCGEFTPCPEDEEDKSDE